MKSDWVEIVWGARRVQIEYGWVGDEAESAPLMVFLHEGLGSVAMWRDFPQQLCAALGFRGLVYSRPGYGRSSPRPSAERWAPDFLHRQADEVLPALLNALGIDPDVHPPWLLGHSDGASIALLYAARQAQRCAGAIVMAPHIMVETISIASIERARQAYLTSDLRERLARFHQDPDSAFWGWNTIWLDAAFRDWSIEDELATIRAPLLAVQGLDDEYGTLEQIRGIAARVPHTRLLEIPACRHSPHRDQPEQLLAAITRFVEAARS